MMGEINTNKTRFWKTAIVCQTADGRRGMRIQGRAGGCGRTQVHGSEPGQARHGVGRLHLTPVAQEDVEDVVFGAGAQGSFVHAATHQLAVLNHHNCTQEREPAGVRTRLKSVKSGPRQETAD